MTNHLRKSTSINLCAFLDTNGCELLGKEPADDGIGRYTFVFRDSPHCQKLVTDFLTGRGGMVDVHQFLEAQKRLKALLFEQAV